MPIDHDFIRTHETDPSGKKVGNTKYTDPDGNEVYLQKVVVGDPEDGTATGLMEVNSGRGQVDAVVTGSVTANAGTNLNTSALLTESDFDTKTGSLTEAAPATDTASSGLNGRLQRIAQRLTSLIALLPTSLGAGGGLKVDGSGTALPVSGTVTATATDLDIRDLTSASDSVAQVSEETEASATWTIATSVDSTVTLACSGMATTMLSVDLPLTITDGAIIAELSPDGGTTWNQGQGYDLYNRPNGPLYQIDGNDGVPWMALIPVAGFTHVRARLTLALDGSGNVKVVLRASAGSQTPAVMTFAGDGMPAALGGAFDAEATDAGSLIGIVKRLRTLLNGGLPAALGGAGGLKAEVVSALPSGTNNIGDVDVLTMPADPFGAAADAAVSAGATGSISAKLRSISRDLVANIVLAAGANIIGKVGIDQTTPGTTNLVVAVGAGAAASPTSGNPVRIGGRASNAIPTDVGADGDTTEFWTNRHGAPIGAQAPHVGLNGDPWSLVHEAAQYTSTQTSTVLIAGGGSEKLVVTKVQIQVFATTAGTVQLYFGTGAFSRGTSRAIFDGEFAPSSTLKPGVVMDGPFIAGTNGDDLLVTTSANISITFNVWYYVVT